MTSNNKGLPQQRALRTREMHRSHTVAFPAFSVAFTPSPTKLLIGGGGGATKAGIKNAVIMAEIQEHDLGLKHLFEHRFEKDDDGCMNIAVHPKEKAFVAAVNSPERTILSGNNRNCRAFRLSKTGMKPEEASKRLTVLMDSITKNQHDLVQMENFYVPEQRMGSFRLIHGPH
ncbi:hypothetical protein BASA82_000923 [Batrachochytrium salamandrivorans]|nr:hypothetical protein BASA82_000923 [Batrachochytrium salamandrivorans]